MIRIPRALADKLQPDTRLDGAVRLSLGLFDQWLAGRNLYFFPEYTDHGPEHVSEVIETAVELMSEGAPVTATDAAVLLIACVLHDCAMHLTQDGLRTLLRPGNGYEPIAGFRDPPWDELWRDFLSEARRFDEGRLRRLFGDSEPIREPRLDGVLDDRDRYLVGEFLRRHHPRIAHEIARYGVPGPGSERIQLKGLDPDLADLAGVVARSHGMSLRACLPYLQRNYHRREFSGVHAAYLMALLRVADYLQIRAERAPKAVLEVRRLRSPISQIEWQVHHSIRNITTAEDDPEAIMIQAKPDNLRAYLRLRQWLDGIQSELDGSWAVLGELYGRNARLAGLGLRLRRVQSNLDDPEEFGREAGFVPVPAAFGAAGARLLHLLVGPLYGDKPEFGIRELLQNAVDAVRELEYLQGKIPRLQAVERIEQEADVVIRLEDDWLTVSDRGIGMTAEVLRDYFLKAGASFRSSDGWKQRFEDDKGRSRVLRSGRFGVGALAAFLLGDHIEVTTRHAEAATQEGITFSAALEDDPIEMRKTKCPVGTTIRVRLYPGMCKTLASDPYRWDWYTLENPSVMRMYRERRLSQRHVFPAEGSELPRKWHRISHPDYSDIQWSNGATHVIVSNGIQVLEEPILYELTKPELPKHWTLELPLPIVSVFDPSGRLPLNLQRTAVMGAQWPFADALREAAIRRFLAATLVLGPQRGYTEGQDFRNSVPGQTWSRFNPGSEWYTSERGIGLRELSLMRESGWEAFLVIPGEGQIELHGVALAPARIPWSRLPRPEADTDLFPSAALPNAGARVFIRNSAGLALPDKECYAVEDERDGWRLYRKGNCPEPYTDFRTVADRLERAKHFHWNGYLIEFYLSKDGPAPPPTLVSKIWNEVIRATAIPFAMEDRRKHLAHAFEALREYIGDFE